MKSRLLSLLTLFFLIPSLCYAQKQANQWYFGVHCGLNFNSGPPEPILNSAITTNEGCSSIADKTTGRTLFYTNGNVVYDSTNNVMPNGSGLGGAPTTTQTLIVPRPGSNTIYYIFAPAYAGSSGGLYVNVVDMTLHGGLGDVTTKDSLLFIPSTEKCAGILACNGTDIWVIGRQSGNKFYAYLITPSGISAPIISAIGTVDSDDIGYLKASPDGSKLIAVFNQQGNIQIFDFDNASGIISNPVTDFLSQAYGASFAPDNSKLYITSNLGVFQYNMLAGNGAAIIASRQTISYESCGALQIGTDGKIYITTGAVGAPDSIGVIENPNAEGIACNFIKSAVYLGDNNDQQDFVGLPDMVENYLVPVFTATLDYNGCPVSNITISDSSISGNISCYWNFDDPSSGTADTSTLRNPTHFFPLLIHMLLL